MRTVRSILLILLCGLTYGKLYDECDTNIPDEFDYIIIGGGTAGSVIANRLSEDPSTSVLVLEAGSKDRGVPESPFISTPALFANMFTTDLMWKYKTEPQAYAFFGYSNNSFNVEMGRVLGGSSSVNGMLYTRGFKSDYDSWADSGAAGWSYEDVLPFFLKAEGSNGSNNENSCGKLSISDIIPTDPVTLAHRAAKEAGLTEHDSRDPNPMGVFFSRYAISSGMRKSAADAYLWPVIGRSNLHIITGAQVQKVIIDDRTKEAQGVSYVQNSRTLIARARLEVIVSAGPYGSPKILMMSGIGPRAHLSEKGINVVANLPVGRNLAQHLYLKLPVEVDMPTLSLRNFSDPKILADYVFHKKGPFSGLVGISDVNCFIKSPKLKTGIDEPIANVIWIDGNLDPILADVNEGSEGGWIEGAKKSRDESRQLKGILAAMPISARPRSKGFIRLRSANYTELPLINPNFLSSTFDVKVLLESIRFVQKMLRTPSLRSVNATFPPPQSTCHWYPYDTDDYWECFIRHFALPTYHGVGTCRMGEGRNSVVDSRLRVKGIRRLRVADASVMPSSPSSNTMAAVYMIAEKAAHMIKEDLHTLQA